MMDEYYQAAFTLKGLRSGPCLDGFARNLDCEGYGWWTVRRHLRSAAHTGRFTQIKGVALNDVTVEWLVHRGIQTTEIYTRGNLSEKLEAINAISPLKLRQGRFRAPDKLIASLTT